MTNVFKSELVRWTYDEANNPEQVSFVLTCEGSTLAFVKMEWFAPEGADIVVVDYKTWSHLMDCIRIHLGGCGEVRNSSHLLSKLTEKWGVGGEFFSHTSPLDGSVERWVVESRVVESREVSS